MSRESEEARREIQSRENEQPHSIDEMPVHDRIGNSIVALSVEMPEPGPNLHVQIHEQAERNVSSMETGNRDEERVVRARRPARLTIGVLVCLNCEENHSQNERDGQSNPETSCISILDAFLAPPSSRTARQENRSHYQRPRERDVLSALGTESHDAAAQKEIRSEKTGEQHCLGRAQADRSPPRG